MALSNQDILFASLMGSDAVEKIERFNLVQDEFSKHALLRIPFLPFEKDNNVEKLVLNNSFDKTFEINKSDNPTPENKQFFPLSFSFTENGQKWTFPYEPMLSISSGNNVIKRNVAKQGDKLIGSIKERWNRKDFDISVTGALFGSLLQGKPEDCYPKKQLIELFEYLKFSKEIYINSYPLECVGVTKVVVEDYSFPFTKGENVQAYDIKLSSDFAYNLLIEENNF